MYTDVSPAHSFVLGPSVINNNPDVRERDHDDLRVIAERVLERKCSIFRLNVIR
jgi:hypothetical protein